MKSSRGLLIASLLITICLVIGSAKAQYEPFPPGPEDRDLLKSWIDSADPVYLISVFSNSCTKVIRNNNTHNNGVAFIIEGSGNLLTTSPMLETSGPNKGGGACLNSETEHQITQRLDYEGTPSAYFMSTAKSVCLAPIMYILPSGICQRQGCALRAPIGSDSLIVTKSKPLADFFRTHITNDTELNRLTGLSPKQCEA
ncbi:hypothetical protein [Vreelandella glaciei]|uniref:hypothetical protein n=1 Tax=Vreelandella glaciei TaxID=186761 RepID=UPI00300210D0